MIIVVGSSNTDLVVNCSHLPAKGETVMGDFLQAGGGKGANQAVAAARLGHEVHFLGCIGQDEFGRNALAGLQAEGVHTDRVAVDETATSGIALIFVDPNGDNMIAVAAGANAALSPQHMQASADLIREADVVLCEFAVPVETVAAAAEIAQQGKACVVLTPAPPLRLDRSFLETVDIITPNETEAQALTGISVTDLSGAEEAARFLVNEGVKAAIITLGERGALFCTESDTYHAPAREVVAVDATAAGDAFSGALAVALAEGKSLREAVDLATCAGALTVTRRGAQPSLPFRDELEAFIAAHP